MLLITKKLIERYGNPMKDRAAFEKKHMTLWYLPKDIIQAIPAMPARLYCNKDLIKPLEAVLRELIQNDYANKVGTLDDEILTFDGCFNIRLIRGSRTEPSVHSWGLAIDLNAYKNQLGQQVTFSKEFLQVFRKHGFTCGADFKRLDGMHFEYTKHL
jgi:hypothetical protein